MSIKPETVAQLQAIMQADSASLAQFNACVDPISAAAIVVKAAAGKGVDVSATDVAAYMKAAAVHQGAMSDTALEEIAAGSEPDSEPDPYSVPYKGPGAYDWDENGNKKYHSRGHYID